MIQRNDLLMNAYATWGINDTIHHRTILNIIFIQAKL